MFFWSEALQGAILSMPLFIGLLAHGLTMKYSLMPALVVPIDGGVHFRGRRLFGDNKTYRGVVAMAVGTGIGFVMLGQAVADGPLEHLQSLPVGPLAMLLGVVVGTVAMLAELPNSALKRQLDRSSASTAGTR